MFSRSFLLQSSLFLCSYFQGENKSFHPYRAPRRNSDHRHSCGDASAGIEQSETDRAGNRLPFQPENRRNRNFPLQGYLQ